MNRRTMRQAAAVLATAAGLTAVTAASADASHDVERKASEPEAVPERRHRTGMHAGAGMHDMHREMTPGPTKEHRMLHDRMHEQCTNQHTDDERDLT